MPFRTLAATAFQRPLRVHFDHAAARHRQTDSVVVRISSVGGIAGFGEGCPRPYVTGETTESALAFIRQHGPELISQITAVDELRHWIRRHERLIDQNPAAFCALELALLDVLARENNCSTERLLALPELSGEFRYTAVIGDLAPDRFRALFTLYCAKGFGEFKIKLSRNTKRDREKFDAIADIAAGGLRFRADANNAWREASDCINFVRSLDFPLFALEEPLEVHDLDGFRRVSEETGCRIILDESFLQRSGVDAISHHPSQWIINCRVSKLGGVIRTLDVIAAARLAGVEVIIGCHVGETSLLSRAALLAAQRSSPGLVAQEGAFGTLLVPTDPFRPIIMFGDSGTLRIPQDAQPGTRGWGMSEAPGFLTWDLRRP